MFSNAVLSKRQKIPKEIEWKKRENAKSLFVAELSVILIVLLTSKSLKICTLIYTELENRKTHGVRKDRSICYARCERSFQHKYLCVALKRAMDYF